MPNSAPDRPHERCRQVVVERPGIVDVDAERQRGRRPRPEPADDRRVPTSRARTASRAASPTGNQSLASARTTATTIGSTTSAARAAQRHARRLRVATGVGLRTRLGYDGRRGNDAVLRGVRDRRRADCSLRRHGSLGARRRRGRHPWEIERFYAYRRLLADHDALDAERVLDVGAGDGWFSEALLADLPAPSRSCVGHQLQRARARHRRSAPGPHDIGAVAGLRPRAGARCARAHRRSAALHPSTSCDRSRRRARRCWPRCPLIPACSATMTGRSVIRRYRPSELLEQVGDVARRRRPRAAVHQAGAAAGGGRGRAPSSRRCGATTHRRRHHGVGEWHHGPQHDAGRVPAARRRCRRHPTARRRGSASTGPVALGVRAGAMTVAVVVPCFHEADRFDPAAFAPTLATRRPTGVRRRRIDRRTPEAARRSWPLPRRRRSRA